MAYTPRGYTTITQIENYLLIDILASFEAQVSEWIAMVEKIIENQTKRIFIADTVASTKKYEIQYIKKIAIGSYISEPIDLIVDDCVEVTELKIDDEVIDSDLYLFYPINELPITRIKLTEDSGFRFTKGEQNIEVTAKWGFSVACPADIAFATTVLVAGIINFSGSMEGEVKSETIGSYSVTYKDDKDWQDFNRAKEILQAYTKPIL